MGVQIPCNGGSEKSPAWTHTWPSSMFDCDGCSTRFARNPDIPRPSLDFATSLWSARCLSTMSSASGCIWSISLSKAHRQQDPLQDVSGSQCFLNWMEEIEECLLLRTWTSTKSTVARAASTRQHVGISGKQLKNGNTSMLNTNCIW